MLISLAIVYIAIVVSAFMMLLTESVATESHTNTTQEALLSKEKTKLPAPVSPATRMNRLPGPLTGIFALAVLLLEISANQGLFHVCSEGSSSTLSNVLQTNPEQWSVMQYTIMQPSNIHICNPNGIWLKL